MEESRFGEQRTTTANALGRLTSRRARVRATHRPSKKGLETGPSYVRGHRGISYRERVDKTRNYQVFWKGGWLPEGGLPTLKDALAYEGVLKAPEAKGERIIVAAKVTFAEVADEWFAVAESELRPG